MNAFEAPGLPMSAQLPASGMLLLTLFVALRIAPSTSARFVVFACWLRFMLSSFHEVTFQQVAGSLSLTALGSASLFLLGLVLLPKTLLLRRTPLVLYAVIGAIVLSALANGALMAAFEPVTKYGLFLMIALHTVRALEGGEERRFVGALILSFSPLLLLQALSFLFDVPKSTEGSGGASFIGGYYHEAAFSIGVVALLIAVALDRTLPVFVKLVLFAMGVASILLANYRTAILATFPLLLYFLLYAASRAVAPRLRGAVSALIGLLLIAGASIALISFERFQDLRTVVDSGSGIIKDPADITRDDRQLLSGRTQIWSEYIDGWKQGGELQKLVGHGPESWQGTFFTYAHNSFISYLYEYGIVGLLALIALFAGGLVAALRARAHRWKLVAGHLSFLVLNLATMPLWLIEGNIVFGLLWGYTLFFQTERKFALVRLNERPALHPVKV